MSYLVFARRFRPQTFSSIVGQEHISEALAASIIRSRIPHALLLTGPRGVGKTTTARVFAKALNCTGRDNESLASLSPAEARKAVEPCGQCPNCLEISRCANLAVREIEGASNNSVENVRELIESLRSLPPPGSRYKMYIIDEVHMLSTAAFNALLKSLEEPPPNTIFIFATTDPQKIPDTVISRCQRYDFHRLKSELIVSQLQEVIEGEKAAVDERVLRLIARKANGGMRDALSLLDRLLAFSKDRIDLDFAQRSFGIVGREVFENIADAVLEQDAQRCFSLIDSIFRESVDLRNFAADFVNYWRSLLFVSIASGKETAGVEHALDLSKDEVARLTEQAKKISAFDCQRLFDVVLEITDRALTSQFPRFVFEAGLAKMAALPSLRPLAQILSTLEGRGGSVPGASAQAARSQTASTAAPVKRPAEFNPSWLDFVTHVKNCSEHVLAAYLRRVRPKTFAAGMLEIEGVSFDITALQQTDALANLRRCLTSYSSSSNWKISFFTVSEAKKAEGGGEEPSAEPKKRRTTPAGSIVAEEEKAQRDRQQQVDSEARSHPLVQAALDTFAGSKIDRVSVLKE